MKMHSNLNELIERGIIDESGRALKEITVFDLLGKESGVVKTERSEYPNDPHICVDCWGVGDPDAWHIIDHWDVKSDNRVIEYRVYDWGGINFDCFFKFDELPTIDANRPYGWSDTSWLMTLGGLATNPEGKAIEITIKYGTATVKITVFSPNSWE